MSKEKLQNKLQLINAKLAKLNEVKARLEKRLAKSEGRG